MVRHLVDQVPGQPVGLQADHARGERLGSQAQPEFPSTVSGAWLVNDAEP